MDKLLQQLAECQRAIDALLANPELTAEQEAQYAQLDKQQSALYAAIGRQKKSDADKAKLAAFQAEQEAKKSEEDRQRQAAEERQRRTAGSGRLTDPDKPGHKTVRTDDEGRETAFFEATDEEISFRVGESADAVRQRTIRAQLKREAKLLKAAGYQPWGEFKSPQDFIRAGFAHSGQQRFDERMHKHFAAVQGMSEGIGADGGYTVMPEFASGMIDRIYSNSLWGRTDNYTVTGNNMTFLANAETSRATGSRHGGLRSYYLAEGATATKSKPTLREITVKLIKVGVLVYLTNELLDDGGSALPTYIRRKVGEEFNFIMGDGLFNGTGAGQPLGILNAPSLISIAKETGQAASTLLFENFNKMYARFFMPNYQRAYWYTNQDTLPQLETLAFNIGTGGQAVWLGSRGMADAPYGTIKSRPLEFTEFNATLGTQGDVILADLGQVLSISKGGVSQAVSMHLEFLTDQLALRFIMRYNATPWETAALTPFKGTNTQASFLTLDTRA